MAAWRFYSEQFTSSYSEMISFFGNTHNTMPPLFFLFSPRFPESIGGYLPCPATNQSALIMTWFCLRFIYELAYVVLGFPNALCSNSEVKRGSLEAVKRVTRSQSSFVMVPHPGQTHSCPRPANHPASCLISQFTNTIVLTVPPIILDRYIDSSMLRSLFFSPKICIVAMSFPSMQYITATDGVRQWYGLVSIRLLVQSLKGISLFLQYC